MHKQTIPHNEVFLQRLIVTMGKIALLSAFTALLIAMSSCSQESTIEHVSLGTTTFHDSFLWSDADTTFLDKTLTVSFNNDAVSRNAAANLVFTDNFDKPVSSQELQIVFEGKLSPDNVIRITPRGKAEQDLNIKFRFLPSAKSGKHQGFILVRSQGLKAVNDVEINGSTRIVQWTMYFEKQMNPLKKGLIILAIVVLVSIGAARLILHRRTFGSTAKKSISATNSSGVILYGPKTLRFKGCSEIVFADHPKEQSALDIFFRGKTLTIVSPAFDSPLRLTPYKKKEIKVSGGGYSLTRTKMKYNDTPLKATSSSTKTTITFS